VKHHCAVGLSAVLMFSSAALGQSRPAAFDPDNLSGVWFRVSPFQTFSSVNNIQPGLGRGGRGRTLVFQEAPFTPAGRAAFEKNKPSYGPRAIPPALGNDPMGTCDPLGVPRILNAELAGAHAFWEIVQTKDRMFQFIGWHHDWREVWTDGRSLPKSDDLEPKWDGYSVGRWDGNTFVVDTIGLDDRTWLDKFGYPHTDQAKLQERYRRLDHDTLELTMTLTDPEYYTRPWMSDTKIFKLEEACVTGRAKCLGEPVTEFPTGESILKNWDEQIYCVPSEEFRFNRRVRDRAAGKSDSK
jgi:hypothetical protein